MKNHVKNAQKQKINIVIMNELMRETDFYLKIY